MAELTPYPFDRLIRRMLREPEINGSIFDVPRRRFVLGDAARDLSVAFHTQRPSSPLGPAAGPQTQMAQNIVLAWLGGARVMELKTVQIQDTLNIPRPCIDMHNVGYNIEWSQELRLEQSIEEYVKAAMLIEILRHSGAVEVGPGFDRVVYDMSVGYDLDGIRSQRVGAFIEQMMDATAIVDRLRTQIPDPYARFRDLGFQTRLSDSLTLSTFHGCPPDEIERIVEHLQDRYALHCIVKLNPTLLGPARVRELLHDEMGYTQITCPDSAFENDTTWDQMVAFVDRLGRRAERRGLGFGVKFTNTLIVENHRDFFPPGEKVMYLSGQPLHVLAMNLVRDFRRQFGDRFPISFSAGIDRHNFPDAVALGLVPVSVCSDLLRPGGYGRMQGYFQSLGDCMEHAGARTIDDFVLRAFGSAGPALESAGSQLTPEVREAIDAGRDLRPCVSPEVYERWLGEARLLNTELYVHAATADPRYAAQANAKNPKKIGSRLELFNCITCDKCIPVCPNDANFALQIPPTEIPIIRVRRDADAWAVSHHGSIVLDTKHQIANFADFCNECGNCDVFCPEDGGPYVIKPRFFGSLQDWRCSSTLDGFHLRAGSDAQDSAQIVHARFEGSEYCLRVSGTSARFSGEGFSLHLDLDDPASSIRGQADGEVDLTYLFIMDAVRRSLLRDRAPVNPVNA